MSARSDRHVCTLPTLQLKELKASVDHDPQQKHVDTFKQAASMWGAMPDDEKKKINDDFKVS